MKNLRSLFLELKIKIWSRNFVVDIVYLRIYINISLNKINDLSCCFNFSRSNSFFINNIYIFQKFFQCKRKSYFKQIPIFLKGISLNDVICAFPAKFSLDVDLRFKHCQLRIVIAGNNIVQLSSSDRFLFQCLLISGFWIWHWFSNW